MCSFVGIRNLQIGNMSTDMIPMGSKRIRMSTGFTVQRELDALIRTCISTQHIEHPPRMLESFTTVVSFYDADHFWC
jgi:hypothetical protein